MTASARNKRSGHAGCVTIASILAVSRSGLTLPPRKERVAGGVLGATTSQLSGLIATCVSVANCVSRSTTAVTPLTLAANCAAGLGSRSPGAPIVATCCVIQGPAHHAWLTLKNGAGAAPQVKMFGAVTAGRRSCAEQRVAKGCPVHTTPARSRATRGSVANARHKCSKCVTAGRRSSL